MAANSQAAGPMRASPTSMTVIAPSSSSRFSSWRSLCRTAVGPVSNAPLDLAACASRRSTRSGRSAKRGVVDESRATERPERPLRPADQGGLELIARAAELAVDDRQCTDPGDRQTLDRPDEPAQRRHGAIPVLGAQRSSRPPRGHRERRTRPAVDVPVADDRRRDSGTLGGEPTEQRMLHPRRSAPARRVVGDPEDAPAGRRATLDQPRVAGQALVRSARASRDRVQGPSGSGGAWRDRASRSIVGRSMVEPARHAAPTRRYPRTMSDVPVGDGVAALPTPAAVLFDLDGTLVDTVETRIAAWLVALDEAGFPTTPRAAGSPHRGGRQAARTRDRRAGRDGPR